MSSIEEDDDFGDFEEATQTEEKEEEAFVESLPVDKSVNVDIEPFENFSQSVDVHLLSDLLNDNELWNIDPTSLYNQSEANLLDLFSHFGCQDAELTPDDAKQAIELWRHLQIIEETNALHFRWPSSQLYSHFIEALSFCESQQSTSSAGIGVPKPSSFLASGEFSVKRPIEDTNEFDLTSNEWTLPDYSNNPNSTLDCDFFQATDYRNNGLSVLEQELCALGLSAQAKSSKQASDPQPVVNGTSHTQQKADHAPRYLSVSELNEDAQAFYERMPDFSFLLVDRVLRKH